MPRTGAMINRRLRLPRLLLAFQQPVLGAGRRRPASWWSSTCGRRKKRTASGSRELTGKCNKDVYRIADVASDPLKVEVLRADLAQQSGLAGDGKTLTVLNWSIYYNKQATGGGPKLERRRHPGLLRSPARRRKSEPGSKCSQRGVGRRLVSARRSHDQWFRRSSRNSREPSAASRSTCASSTRARREDRGQVQGRRERHRRSCSTTVHKTAEALATAIVQ